MSVSWSENRVQTPQTQPERRAAPVYPWAYDENPRIPWSEHKREAIRKIRAEASRAAA